MQPPEDGSPTDHFAALPNIPRDEDGPVFAEPWQAQAFALVVRLSAEQHFTWSEWSSVFSDELKAAAASGTPDDGSSYYHHWLTALERLVVEKRLTDPSALHAQKEAWREAYLRTPHGKPVSLEK